MLYSAIYDIYSVFKEYNKEALIAAMVAILLYIAAMVVVFVVHNKKNIPHRKPAVVISKLLVFMVLGIYFSYLTCLTLSGREAGSRGEIMNIIPFATIFEPESFSVTLLENIILFIPFGTLLPIIWEYFRGSIRTTMAGLIASAVIETLQLITGRGYFDTDDIILNTCGAVIGYLLFAGVYDGYYGIKRRIIVETLENTEAMFQGVYKRFALTNAKVLFAVQSAPVIGWYLIIMGFSSNNGYQSGFLSKSLLYNMLSAIGGARTLSKISDDINTQMSILNIGEATLRKIAHLTEYGIFAVLVWAMLYSIIKLSKVYAYNIALIAVSATGTIDEINQMSIEGRNGTYLDVIIDLVGASIALIVVTLLMVKIRDYYQKKNLNQKEDYNPLSNNPCA